MIGLKESAETAAERVKATAQEARDQIEKVGAETKARAVRVADRWSGRTRRRRRAALIAGVVIVAAAVIVSVMFAADRKNGGWLP